MEEQAIQPTVFDTDQQVVGDIYAKALLGFGKQQGNSDQLVSEVSAVVDALGELPKLKRALGSPRISWEAKSGVLEKAFQSRVSKETMNFLKVVGQRGRFNCLGAIAASASRMQDEAMGRVKAMMTTAAEVDDSVKQKVSSQLAQLLGKEVNLSAHVDPDIIGGMVVRVGDTVYDGSVKNQLEQVRSKAVKRAADAIRENLDRFTGA